MKQTQLFPRWGIVVVDLLLSLVALAGAYQLRFNFQIPPVEVDLLLPVLPLYLAIRVGSFLIAGLPRMMVRHTNTDDARRIFLTVLGGTLAFGLISVLRYLLFDGYYFLPISVIIIDFMGTTMLLITSRIAFKLLHLRSRGAGKDTVRVLIHGAGEAGLITKRTLEREGSVRYSVEGFIDDAVGKTGKRLEGSLVQPTAKLPELLKTGAIDQVIIAIQRPDPENRRRVVDACMAAKVQVLTIPPVSDWINGQLSAGQIKDVRIEDLLGRPVIQLDDAQLHSSFSGRCVLVTGAAGSIGSELARQLAQLGIARLVLVDIAESGLYDIETELTRMHVPLVTRVADVRDRSSMEAVFAAYRPQVVFHAAAYKHVPLMEAQPDEAIHTNIAGTRTVAEVACAHGVERFILISTDKAVNPTSVMGASKRIAEMVVNSLSRIAPDPPQFITTRFGNVLGSSGSVIPLFRKQIAAGGPVTVTDPEVTRFFMTIPEACRLVLEAATMGKGGEIFVFDMGEPVRIADLAEKMIRLSGLEPEVDIAIVYTGLRPGEKLYEELLATAENTLATHHPRILIGQVRSDDPATVLREVTVLTESSDVEEQVRLMKQLVPEYRSHNSVYSNFDAPLTKIAAPVIDNGGQGPRT
ncbi:MAG: polysaccharide biosynthesis protein [Flavobacteriales bacterium]|jgi:FlaA1/EpsC-like NDP-sugar epimerase|nr:polysaccharide biosynthesis protein [Flavobacteriales bacterium]MBK6551589.1 polysaccharide biosynthesis protein [Flavobacteriales bacterium]MBK6882116.1 polysaccharide biosynthesis protein [Flavobacteriales bacterium]MBK7101664.1 polysaccharide biosynthesis protein [Flavobacteriales bacterium]MBK7112371.1 polysaccharide biosynthesis protein [Flavobacteriales bacterium]